MAQQTTVRYLDDLDGTEGAQQVRFGMDGVAYEIDLAEVNELQLRSLLAPYIKAGRKAGRVEAKPAAQSALTRRADLAPVREWAAVVGIPIKTRGRISADVLEQYQRSHAA
jgi:hypothetical protein